MKILGKIIKYCYVLYLQKKWKVSRNASNMVANLFIREIKQKRYSRSYIKMAHSYGYSVDAWRFLRLNKNNYKEYLSTVQYISMHPINGRYTSWINDKLTLKYMCNGTDLQEFMPKYYYQIDSLGNIIPLIDKEDCSENTPESVVDLLQQKKVLAIKLIAGSIGEGFIKAEFYDEKYFFNGKQKSRDKAIEFISELRDYLITEYLFPHKEFNKFCPNTCNSIRYLVGRIDGSIKLLKSFIRFGTTQSKFVENFNRGGILCYINEQGKYNGGYKLNFETCCSEQVFEHPDTKEKLVGLIPEWKTIVNIANLFCEIFPQLNYLGFDFVVCSDNSVKVLEINSLTSLDSLQLDGTILNSPAGEFYKKHLIKK